MGDSIASANGQGLQAARPFVEADAWGQVPAGLGCAYGGSSNGITNWRANRALAMSSGTTISDTWTPPSMAQQYADTFGCESPLTAGRSGVTAQASRFDPPTEVQQWALFSKYGPLTDAAACQKLQEAENWISSVFGDEGDIRTMGNSDIASNAWKAYSGAMAGEFNAAKDFAWSAASLVNDSDWQLINLVSGGLASQVTSEIEQANYRQGQRTQAVLGGLRSLSVNAGLTVVDPVGQVICGWDALSAEAGRIGEMYRFGDVYGAFERGSRDFTNATLMFAPAVGPTTRTVEALGRTAGTGAQLALGGLAVSRAGQLVNEKLLNLQNWNGSYAVPPVPSFARGVAAEIGNVDDAGLTFKPYTYSGDPMASDFVGPPQLGSGHQPAPSLILREQLAPRRTARPSKACL